MTEPSAERHPILRILVVGLQTFADEPGGLSRYVDELVRALPEARIKPVEVTFGKRSDGATTQRIVLAPSGSTVRKLFRLWRATRRIATRPDVIDSHFALHALPFLHTRRFRGVRHVAHFHGPWADESRVEGQGPITVMAKRTIEKHVYRKVAAIVVLSPAFKRVLVECYHIEPWKIRVVPPGVDLKHFRPTDQVHARRVLGFRELDEDAFVALALRRLVPRMGHQVLLKAWADLVTREGSRSLHDRELRHGFRLLIGGDGPLRNELERAARQLGLQDLVDFLGIVPQEALPLAYSAADVTVVPSVTLEGYGMTVLESLACGTPVLASRIGGLPAALEPFDPNLLIPAGNPIALRDALEAFVLPDHRPRSRTDCRRYAEGFSWKAAAATHRGLYEEVLRGPTPRPLRPRLVFLDHSAQLSGAEIALTRILPSLGVEVDAHVVLGEDGPLVGRLQSAGISVEVLPLPFHTREIRRHQVRLRRLSLRGPWSTLAYVIRLRSRLRLLAPDLVQTNSLKAALYGTAAGKIAGIPVVTYIHDRVARDYLPSFGVDLIRFACRKLAVGVIANSEATLATLLPLRNHAVVTPPVPASVGPRHDSGSVGSRFKVACIGRISPWKGQDLFLRAFALAFAGGEEQALIVGAPLFGEDEYERLLQDLPAELGISGQVELRGFQEDVAAVLQEVDVVVHTSLIPEPFGQVVAEAMASGKCVIASAEGGPASLINDGVDGLLCEPGNAESYAKALLRVRRDASLRGLLGANALSSSATMTPESAARKLLTFYRSLAVLGV